MSRMGRVLAASVVIVSFLSAGARAEDHREVQGRSLFAKGDYQAALDIYANLFGEKGDAIYLRNIGRCYQKLQQPEKSIDAFREYLRRGHVKPAERSEVEGFISEMEQLQKERAAAAPTAPPPVEPVHPASAPEAAPPSPAPAVVPPPASDSAPGATLTQQATTDEQASTPITHRWWFWTGIGAVVAGGVVAAILLSRPSGGGMPPCTASVCQ